MAQVGDKSDGNPVSNLLRTYLNSINDPKKKDIATRLAQLFTGATDSFYSDPSHKLAQAQKKDKGKYDGEIMAVLSEAMAMLKAVHKAFLAGVCNAGVSFRIGLNTWAYNMLNGIMARVQHVLDLATSSGSTLQTLATTTYTMVASLTGITKQNIEGQKDITKGNQNYWKEPNDLSKMA